MKTIYKNAFVLEISTKKKQKYYTISKWDEQGMKQGTLQKGKLIGEPKKILDDFISTLLINCEDRK